MPFTHLHVHTEYSLLDGAARIKDLMAKAVELNMQSIAITDHGVMYGVLDFYAEAKKAGIKPIVGCEVYVVKNRHEKTALYKEYSHLVLLCKNMTGYKNLLKLSSIGFLEGYYYKPRIDYDVLEEHKEGLVCLSACLAGDIPRLLLNNNYVEAKELAQKLKDMFKDDFYLEIQNHYIPEQIRINPMLIKLANELQIKLVATNDVHYTNKDDCFAQKVLVCIQTVTTIDEPSKMTFSTKEFYLKSQEEMQEIFSNIPEVISNTQEVADKCNLEIEFGNIYLPVYKIPTNQTNFEYLKEIATKGLSKYKDITDEINNRLNYELNMIEKMGFTDYFLIVWDFVAFAKNNKIMVGPGRGSAAGSIVAYTLGITNIDPIKYNLLFERFLNPERISMPDIDIDFCIERRQEVIDYVSAKYGEDRVAQIITFGTMGARLVIRDVARVMNMSIAQADKIAKMVPFELKMTIDKALKSSDRLRIEYETNDEVKKVIDIAKRLEGMPRHASTHAAGVVISKEPITQYVPLQKNMKDESITTQYTMKKLEELGLLKMDFLGLRTLTVIRDALAIIKQNHNIDIDIDNLDFADKKVYELISNGHTQGVFQLESPGMTRLMQDLAPENLDEIMVGISLFRPGPMESIPEYIRCKRNASGVHYAHPLLEPILKDTYGCMVYQEQIMRIVRDVAGYSMARSDLVRRAMSKKQQDVLEKERDIFINGEMVDGQITVDGAIRRGVSKEVANELFSQMMAFANYAFNKSHACAYAVIAYQTAYLKCYYKVEFMTALLNSFISAKQKLAEYIQILKYIDVEVLPPHINKSHMKFEYENNAIRFGLSAISYVGEAIEDVISRRGEGYRDFEDFVYRNTDVLNKKRLESLILSGCFDCFKINRSCLVAVYEKFLQNAINAKKRLATGQISFFDGGEQEVEFNYPNIPEYETLKKLSYEKEMTGIYISGHPLDSVAEVIKAQKNSVTDIMKTGLDEMTMYKYDTKHVEVMGILTSVKSRLTKQKKIMANAVLEDLFSQIGLIIFPNVYTKTESIIKADNIVVISGKITVSAQNGIELLCENISKYIPDELEYDGRQLYVKLSTESQTNIDGLFEITKDYKGNSSIVVHVEKTRKTYKLCGARSVVYSKKMINELNNYLGEENVCFKDK